jgi:hypothetical protein
MFREKYGMRPKSLASAFVLVVLLSLTASAQSQEQQTGRCNLRSLRGSYGFLFKRTIIGFVPFAAGGVQSFDGQGNLGATG